ncbi:MAG: DUF2027 domain-containing protein [Paludibacteraceae bacterium]
MIHVGDKVRFLNAAGGGVVTGFQSKDVALVRDEDDFEIPTHVRDLVAVVETDQYNFPTADKPMPPAYAEQPQTATQPADEDDDEPTLPPYAFNERDETPEGEQLSIYLAFVPTDIKQLQTCDMDVYLVNDSNYYLNFNLLHCELDAEVVEQNRIEPQTKLLLQTIDKTALNGWENVRFQALAYKRKPFAPKPAVDVELHINPVRFYKLHSFGSNDFFEHDALLVTVVERDVFDLDMQIDANALLQAILQKNMAHEKPRVFKSSKQPQPVVEIDLHINALLDNTNGMTNADMLQYQLDKFHSVMREYAKRRGQKIIFIHGKGEGVLRAAIEKELKTHYRTCYFQDASFQQYGFGATQVTIR